METKICKECGKELPLTEEYFYKNKTAKDGFINKCKECCTKYSKKYYKNNIDKIKEKDKKYYEDNKEKIIKRQTNYYYENQEQYSQYYFDNKQEKLEYQKEYNETHPDIIRECHRRKEHKRRALEFGQGGSYTKEEWEKCLEFFNYKCCYSGEDLNNKNLTIEHIIPISKGGTNYIWNIACCDFNVNSSKGNKDLEVWYKKQPFFNQERLNKIYEWIKINKNKKCK